MDKIQPLGKCIKTLDEIVNTVQVLLSNHGYDIYNLKDEILKANEELHKQQKLGQCEAITDKGRRCCRDQHPEFKPFCKSHKYVTFVNSGNKPICLYGSIDIDDENAPWFSENKNPCKHTVDNDSWFCKKHGKYQKLANNMYGFNSLQQYNECKDCDDFIADEHIENYKIRYTI